MTTSLEDVPPRVQVALLIDGDPLPPEVIGQALAKAETFGNVTIRRVYANWKSVSRSWEKVLNRYQVTYQYDGTPPKGKNATDIALVVDALKLFYRNGIRHFCLVASDSDYTALVRELRKEGCMVLGIGQVQTPLTLQQAYTTFLFTKQLPAAAPLIQAPSSPSLISQASKKVKQPKQKKTSSSPVEILTTLLVKACRQVIQTTKKEWIALSALGQALKQHDPKFKTGSYGYGSLTKLVAAQKKLLEVRGQGGNVQVRLRAVS
jgi:hypothetical protein